AFRFIRAGHFNHVLGIGAAYGDEFKPIAGNIARITILEPSDTFSSVTEIFGIPCEYKRPNILGDIEFESDHFDLITSLDVIHHIPNISHVLAECYRCLCPDGIMLLREPIASLGDWRKPRKGPTRRERGIPLRIMDNMIKNTGFKTIHRSLCNFAPIPAILNKLGLRIHAYNNVTLAVVDALLSQAFSWNNSYHRTSLLKKFAPSLVYYVLKK
ncbi:MAG TPA: class I SAM-dependent methyltransferase, partial [Syntrophorhabdaceae bacterium]|nr:class I SAM-dependent methyltransferase [Syntrophorhabdaceae bacterium]